MDKHNREILQLTLPSVVSNITVPLLGLVDVAIAGHIGDATYIGAIAIGSMIFNIIYWIFGFLRMGTSGMTSQALGRRDLAEVMRTLVRALRVGIGVALCFVMLQVPLRMVALGLMNTPDDIVPLVSRYFNIVIWGAPAMLGLYGMTGWYVGMQNTRVPMVVAIVQNIVNIGMSMLLVFGLRMRIEGVALGTLTAQWAGFVMALVIWRARYGRLVPYLTAGRTLLSRVGDIIFHERGKWGHFFTVNRDIFLRTLCLVAVNLFFTSAGALQGATVLAVNTLLMTLFTLFSYIMDGFAHAGEALSGRYYGAGNVEAFRDTVRKLFVWATGVSLVFTLLYIGGGSGFLSLLTDDRTVIEASADYVVWAYAIPLAGMAAFVFDGIFIGVTATRGMLQSSFVATAVFFAVYYLLRVGYHNHALWLALLLYLVCRGLVQAFLYRRIRLMK